MKFPIFDLSSVGRTSSTALPGRGVSSSELQKDLDKTELGEIQIVSFHLEALGLI